MSEPLLEVSNLTLDYNLGSRKMRALDRINFTLQKGEVLGVAGESGCGKSTLGLAILRLLPRVAEIKRGAVFFKGSDLLEFSEEQMSREIRGQEIAMIFQNPQNALKSALPCE